MRKFILIITLITITLVVYIKTRGEAIVPVKVTVTEFNNSVDLGESDAIRHWALYNARQKFTRIYASRIEIAYTPEFNTDVYREEHPDDLVFVGVVQAKHIIIWLNGQPDKKFFNY